MDRKIDVKVAAQLAEMPVDEFLYLNPQHNRPVIAGADDYTILLPIDKAELFAAKLQLTNQPLVSWQAYRVRNGETLAQIAAKYGLGGRGAAGRERHRLEGKSAHRAHAARPHARSGRGRRGYAVDGCIHDRAARAYVLLPHAAR
jgi:hypothetical protein